MKDDRHYLAVTISGHIARCTGYRNLVFLEFSGVDVCEGIRTLRIYDAITFSINAFPLQSSRIVTRDIELRRGCQRDKK